VDKEHNVLMESFKEQGGTSGAPPTSTALAAAEKDVEKDDDAVSVVGSLASHRSGASITRSNATKRSVARSDVSSNVSTNSATERKLKLLEEQLKKEQAKRKELEDLLKVKAAPKPKPKPKPSLA
jgi:hypothetical protein|tara:strand:+ start:315 stop:689 length:375 start_codon:yes stop_codon:yes gene_type:complete